MSPFVVIGTLHFRVSILFTKLVHIYTGHVLGYIGQSTTYFVVTISTSIEVTTHKIGRMGELL